MLGYSVGHIYNLVNLRQIPFKKLSRKALRFDPQEIERWIIERNDATKTEVSELATVADRREGPPDRRTGPPDRRSE